MGKQNHKYAPRPATITIFTPIYYTSTGRPMHGKKLVMKPVFVSQTLTFKDVVALLSTMKKADVVYYRPAKKSDWPQKPKPVVAVKPKTVKNPVSKIYGHDEAGVPIYDKISDEELHEELKNLFGEYESCEDDDTVTITCPKALSAIPDQSAGVIRLHSYYLTHSDLLQIQRVLKWSGSVQFVTDSFCQK